MHILRFYDFQCMCIAPTHPVLSFSLTSQATLLREELVGFVFESNRGTKHSFTAETSLGPEFSVGWGGKRSRKLRSKTDAARSKVRDILCVCVFYVISLDCV